MSPEPEELGGFDFSSLDKPKVEILDARELSVSEAVKALRERGRAKSPEHRLFKINTEGVVEAHGYTPAEVAQLLADYREHMVAFAKSMQSLSEAASHVADAFRDTGNGGYQ